MISNKLKTAILAGSILLGSLPVVNAASVLGKYFDATSMALPDKLALSVYEEVRYEDNLFNSGSGERGGIVFATGAKLDASRTRGEFSYDVKADVAYDHYHKFASDLGTPVYSIAPSMRYDQGNWDIMLGGNFKYEYSKVDVVGTPRAKFYTSGVDATWNLHLNEKWGVAVTGEWENKDYTQRAMSYLDYDKYEVAIAPYYVFSPKTKAGVYMGYAVKEYEYGDVYSDSDTITLNGFVDYRVTGKISAHATAGAEFVDYDNVDRVYRENDPLFNCGLTVRYAALTNLAFLASVDHKHDDNSGGGRGFQQDTDTRLGMVWDINSKLSLTQNVGYSWSDKKNGSSADNKELSYDAVLSYMMTKNLTIYGGYEFGNTDYTKIAVADADYTTNIYHMGISYTF